MSHKHHDAHHLVSGKPDGKHSLFSKGKFKVHAHVKDGKVSHLTAEGPSGPIHISKVYTRSK